MHRATFSILRFQLKKTNYQKKIHNSKFFRNFVIAIQKDREMTQITLNNNIDPMQMNVLMGLFNSWNVNVQITDEKVFERQKELPTLKMAAERLYADYTTNKDLTIFTNLDKEDFYETR
jgi:hypothetical protein